MFYFLKLDFNLRCYAFETEFIRREKGFSVAHERGNPWIEQHQAVLL